MSPARSHIPPGKISLRRSSFPSGGLLNSCWNPAPKSACLASYSAPGAGFQVADLRVCDVDESAGWGELEKAYGINLDPGRIKGHPAIIEVEKGKGRLVLSYAHLETPGDRWGNRLFFNILNYLNDSSAISTPRELPGDPIFPRSARHPLSIVRDFEGKAGGGGPYSLWRGQSALELEKAVAAQLEAWNTGL